VKQLLFPDFQSGTKHMLLAVGSFAIMNLFVKFAERLPVMELVFFRCGISTVLSIGILRLIKINWTGSNKKLLILRGVFGTLALLTYFATIKKMPLGTAVTVQYLSPVFTTVIAFFFLSEKIRPVQWLFFLISFAGVAIIKGFDTRISFLYLGIGILSAVFSALAYNLVRTLSGKEHPLVVVLHFQLIGTITGLAFSVFNWVTPYGIEWFYILMIGISTQLGQEHLTRAYQKDKAAKVSIINYLGVILAVAFGFYFFDETYTILSLSGVLLVTAGVIFDVWFRIKNDPLQETTE